MCVVATARSLQCDKPQVVNIETSRHGELNLNCFYKNSWYWDVVKETKAVL